MRWINPADSMKRVWMPLATTAMSLSLLLILPVKLLGSCGSPLDALPLAVHVSALVLASMALIGIVATRRHAAPGRFTLFWSVLAAILSLIIVLMPPVPVLGGFGLC